MPVIKDSSSSISRSVHESVGYIIHSYPAYTFKHNLPTINLAALFFRLTLHFSHFLKNIRSEGLGLMEMSCSTCSTYTITTSSLKTRKIIPISFKTYIFCLRAAEKFSNAAFCQVNDVSRHTSQMYTTHES